MSDEAAELDARAERQEAQELAESGGPNPPLRRTEQKEALRRTAPSAGVVYEAIRKEGRDELRRSSQALAWSGLAAGLSMGFSMIAEGLLRTYLPDVPWRPIVMRMGYTIGFLIVILGRQQLFTENTLTPILPLLAQRDLPTLGQVLRLWSVVLASNLAGAFIFAWIISHTQLFEPGVQQSLTALSNEVVTGTFFSTFLRGIFAGWLIALMVWLLPFAEVGRIWVIIIISYVVGLGGFAHIVVGSVEVFYAVGTGTRTLGSALTDFILPTLLGNITGGVALVALLGHAQVVAGAGAEDD